MLIDVRYPRFHAHLLDEVAPERDMSVGVGCGDAPLGIRKIAQVHLSESQ
jgi:hypothetical protein